MSPSFKPKRANPVSSAPLSGVKDGIVKNTIQPRKFIPPNGNSGLRRRSSPSHRNKAILALVLFMSSYCIQLAHSGQVSPSSINGLGKGLSSSSSAGGKDGSGGGNKADDGESLSSSHHHHHPHHHRHHRHGGGGSSSPSGKNSPYYASSMYPSTSASLDYHQYYSPLSYYPEAYYEPRYHERPSREFSARSTNYPALAAAASSQVGFTDTEYGGLALATGHGGGHGGGHHDGGGHGHGHGQGYHTTYHKTINKLDQSSLGLLGLLGLLSLLSNVLLLLTTTATMAMQMPAVPPVLFKRKKRDTMMLVKLKDDDGDGDLSSRSVFERLSRLILPSLNVVGHAKDGRIPLNCTFQEVCKTNKVLVQVFGPDDGRPVASVLSTAIVKLLMDNNKPRRKDETRIVKNWHYKGTTKAPVLISEKLLSEAGVAGRNGADCEVAYPTCTALDVGNTGEDNHVSSNGVYRRGATKLPLLVSPEHALAIIMGQPAI